jgi:hypothetical protein
MMAVMPMMVIIMIIDLLLIGWYTNTLCLFQWIDRYVGQWFDIVMIYDMII